MSKEDFINSLPDGAKKAIIKGTLLIYLKKEKKFEYWDLKGWFVNDGETMVREFL